jgi:hypothetical protein
MEGEAIASSLTAARSGRIIFANAETARRHLSVYAERTFHREKAAVTNALPDAYKSRWKKWCVLDAVDGGKGDPCYVLSPYDVPPGPHRTSWMEWFEQVRAFVSPALCLSAPYPERWRDSSFKLRRLRFARRPLPLLEFH